MQKRPLTSKERSILDRLLSKPFLGRDEVMKQLEGCLAASTNDDDNYGSVHLFPANKHRAETTLRVPVEGISNDLDGGPVNILLHVVDGYLHELEVVKLDATALKADIDPDSIKVVVNS